MLKLKRCPFCGGEAHAMVTRLKGKDDDLSMLYSVACRECNAMIGTFANMKVGFYDTPGAAAEVWNSRARGKKRKGR